MTSECGTASTFFIAPRKRVNASQSFNDFRVGFIRLSAFCQGIHPARTGRLFSKAPFRALSLPVIHDAVFKQEFRIGPLVGITDPSGIL